MDVAKPTSRQNLIQELMKSNICASINGAEIMADEIMCREKETIEDCKTLQIEAEKKNGRRQRISYKTAI